MIYQSLNIPVVNEIPDGVKTLLDIGCGSGELGAYLTQFKKIQVTGVTFSADEAALAESKIERVVVQDLEKFDAHNLQNFDCIVCSHVLEHLRSPGDLLQDLKSCFLPSGVLVVALPNVLHWRQRFQFMFGRFRYTEGGLMDNTHLRFYDWTSANALLTQAGFEIVHRYADGYVPFSRFLGKRLSVTVSRLATNLAPGFFGHQFIFQCVLGRNSNGLVEPLSNSPG